MRRSTFLTGLLGSLFLATTAGGVEPDNTVAPPETVDAPVTGPLELSVEEAVALALQANPELLAERQNPIIAGTFADVERARFDPSVFASASIGAEVSQQQFANTNENLLIERDTKSAAVGLRQYLPTGTDIELSVSQDKFESNRAPTQAGARVGLTLTQALLRGAGIGTNLVALRQARTDVAASAYQLRGFVATLVAEVERTYWQYLGARERIRILESSLELAQRQVEQARQRIDAGTVARTELAAVKAEVARRRQALIDGRAEAERLKASLLRQINPPGRGDGEREIRLASEVEFTPGEDPVASEHIDLALARRPEINEARLLLARNELQVVATRNGLLPRLDLFVTLGQTGFSDSFGEAYSQVDSGDTYDLSAALEFEYPLGNRAAEAEDLRARREVAQAEASLANLGRLISAEVRNAVIEARRAAAQIDATAATLALQEETLEAEQARFEVGRSTSLLVAQAQRDLLAAQLDRADAFLAYRQALIDLYRLDGSLLIRRLIDAPGEKPPDLPWLDSRF
ncbi:TolC family protein [Spectribacter hydrogenoxidans]|uniref:TolC family protein n=1 Tax=Spectribacter hydrogenoxidans TaxID=3075608 RepID=A0ABU3BZ43_9GAMM|nr:TolC family protein [Salinisphaera sp. W335]MDT0634577.1 TolC family protein [Salinisphaera sp. W335]